jgi:hypothetical protein
MVDVYRRFFDKKRNHDVLFAPDQRHRFGGIRCHHDDLGVGH